MRDPLSQPPPRRHPFQVWVLWTCSITGLALALGGPEPGSFEALLPQWAITVWWLGLILSGLTGLAAALWRDEATATLLEFNALVPLACLTGAYAVAIAYVGGRPAWANAALISVFAFSAGIRAGQVWRLLWHVRRRT